MDKWKNEQYLTKLISSGLTQREIAKECNVSQSTIKYWLKKFSLKTSNDNKPRPRPRPRPQCRYCGDDKLESFYRKQRRMCKKCDAKRIVELSRSKKARAVEYKGGECERCGYHKYHGSLAFHHVDPSSKDPNFNSMNLWKWDRIKEEIDKCMLLCTNCHQELHGGVWAIGADG